MYADDTAIHASTSTPTSVEQTLQLDLDRVADWMKINRLKLNTDKTVSMLIGSPPKVCNTEIKLIVNVDDSQIQCVHSTKYLGITIDNTLSWDDHCQKILHSIRGKITVLSRLQPIPPHITALLYKSYVLPVFDYCAAVWQPHSRIEAAMERLHFRVSSLALHQDSLLSSSLRSRQRYHIAVQVYKAIHYLSPYFSNTFTLSSSLTGRPLRNPHSLHIPTVRTNYGKSSFYYRGGYNLEQPTQGPI